MKTAAAAKVAAQFNSFLETCAKEPVLVTQNGKPVAVLIAVQDKDDADQIVSGRPRTLRSVLKESHEAMKQKGGIPHDQFWREVEQSRHVKPAASQRKKRA